MSPFAKRSRARRQTWLKTFSALLGLAILGLAACSAQAGGQAVWSPSVAPSAQAFTPEAPSASAIPESVSPSPTTPPNYIESAQWVENDKGWTLKVTPTEAARHAIGSLEAGEVGFAQLEERFGSDRLAAHRDSLRKQYICHQEFATIADPDKPTWDLEAWRPDVPYAEVVAALCNPGGPE